MHINKNHGYEGLLIVIEGTDGSGKSTQVNMLSKYIKDKCFGGEKSFIPPVRCATLGNNAGIIGALYGLGVFWGVVIELLGITF